MDRNAAERGLTRVVGVGASAGGVDALIRIVRTLPADFPAAICIVLHVPATGRSLLAPILDRQTALEVVVPEDGEAIRPGRVYVAPPDRHLTVAAGSLELGRGPKENGVRPAVDPMLRSLAAAYGEQAVAVVLSGALGDGSTGALAVKQAGRRRARAGSRRRHGAEHARERDARGRRGRRGACGRGHRACARRAHRRGAADTGGSAHDRRRRLARLGPAAARRPAVGVHLPRVPRPAVGGLRGDVVRYRCRVGHAYSEDSMVVEQGSQVEAALWSALEALEERAEFLARMSPATPSGGRGCTIATPARPRRRERAELIRRALGSAASAERLRHPERRGG